MSGGLSRNYTGLRCNTVLFGEYFEGKNFIEQVGLNVGANDTVSMWGIGLTQHIDAAAMEVYVAYKSYSIDCAGGPCFANGYSDFQAVLAGTKINF